jgi:ribosomal protein S18 acetylase RimI-like enzyme
MIELTLAKETDFKTIAKLAKVIWNAHYVAIIGQEQVNYMLDKIYNYDSLLEQLNKKKHVFYLIKSSNETVGFLSISTENNEDYFLHKFYIDQQKSNTGIGTQTLNLLQEIFRPKRLILTVNRNNIKSINFYFKNGFKIESIEDFDIGNGYQMNDFVMKKTV